MGEEADYAESGSRVPEPGSPLLGLILLALVLMVSFLPCWIVAAALLLPPP